MLNGKHASLQIAHSADHPHGLIYSAMLDCYSYLYLFRWRLDRSKPGPHVFSSFWLIFPSMFWHVSAFLAQEAERSQFWFMVSNGRPEFLIEPHSFFVLNEQLVSYNVNASSIPPITPMAECILLSFMVPLLFVSMAFVGWYVWSQGLTFCIRYSGLRFCRYSSVCLSCLSLFSTGGGALAIFICCMKYLNVLSHIDFGAERNIFILTNISLHAFGWPPLSKNGCWDY